MRRHAGGSTGAPAVGAAPPWMGSVEKGLKQGQGQGQGQGREKGDQRGQGRNQ